MSLEASRRNPSEERALAFDFTLEKALCLENTQGLVTIGAAMAAATVMHTPVGIVGAAAFGALYNILGQPICWVCKLIGVHCAKMRDTIAKVMSAFFSFISSVVIVFLVANKIGFAISFVSALTLGIGTAGIGFAAALAAAAVVYAVRYFVKRSREQHDLLARPPGIIDAAPARTRAPTQATPKPTTKPTPPPAAATDGIDMGELTRMANRRRHQPPHTAQI